MLQLCTHTQHYINILLEVPGEKKVHILVTFLWSLIFHYMNFMNDWIDYKCFWVLGCIPGPIFFIVKGKNVALKQYNKLIILKTFSVDLHKIPNRYQ